MVWRTLPGSTRASTWIVLVSLVSAAMLSGASAQDRNANRDSGAKDGGAKAFSADCSSCHKNAAGLGRDQSSRSLADFLKQHYTTEASRRAEIANYVAAVNSDPRAAQQRPSIRQEGEPDKPEPQGRTGRTDPVAARAPQETALDPLRRRNQPAANPEAQPAPPASPSRRAARLPGEGEPTIERLIAEEPLRPVRPLARPQGPAVSDEVSHVTITTEPVAVPPEPRRLARGAAPKPQATPLLQGPRGPAPALPPSAAAFAPVTTSTIPQSTPDPASIEAKPVTGPVDQPGFSSPAP